ncbi:putative transcription factor C2H2 family [Helianthus debilis subsp. tardiflorus]
MNLHNSSLSLSLSFSLSLSKMNKMIHASSPEYSHSSHTGNFPFIAVAIIGICATISFLVFYYIFVIKCCLNWHRIDILRRFSLSRSANNHYHHHHPLVPLSPEHTGLHESVIRSIPIFRFRKHKHSDNECAVCLGEFQEDERLRMIPNCAHVFHIDCIDVWLQNNPNCPLCRNSISVSIPLHIPIPEHSPRVRNDEENYVVIELHGDNGGGGGDGDEGRDVSGERGNINSGEPVIGKLTEKFRKRYGYNSSMGDECIGVNTRRKGDDQFVIQTIRRSFSMDSASDRQLFLAVQEIRNSLNHVDVIGVNEEWSSNGNSNNNSNRLRRGFFSFGHARSAILPCHLKP